MSEQKIPLDKNGAPHQDANDGHEVLTTSHGVPIGNNQSHLRIGDIGPLLMEDFHFREKIFHFDHERIPERVVHARGYGAHGYFETTADLSDITSADIFQRKNETTPVFVRFSTVAGSKGSADLARDVRGFAVKFYTQEGNWDLVGNNIPVFFIQDPIKFPDLVHSVKEEPDRGFPQAQSAHDNFWDFISLSPESMHMVMWVMSDRTIPRSLRFMEGFGVHTFRFVNKKGKSTFVKFHWRPKLGVQSVVWDEAVKINGADPDFHRRDLWNAISKGDFPEWELGIQTFDEKFAESFDFSILDPTKLIPEEIIPLKIVGRLVLDRVVDNFFAETEQVAFLTHNVVPGIDFTDDPLLQGRNFSYLDTQLKRLGSPNFAHLPINAPKCPMHAFNQDGHMATNNRKGRVNYEPNSWGTEIGGPRESRERGFTSFPEPVSGEKLRVRAEAFADHYSQARQFYISQSILEKKHIADALTFELSKVETPQIRESMVGHLRNIDDDLAIKISNQLGMKLPEPIKPAKLPIVNLPKASSLSLMAKPTTFAGRKLGILLANGADAGIFHSLVNQAVKLKATVEIIAPQIGNISLNDNNNVLVDHFIGGTSSVLFDAVVLLIPDDTAIDLSLKPKIADFVTDAINHYKFIGYSPALITYLEKIDLESQMDKGCFLLTSADNVTPFMMSLNKLRYWEREGELAKA
jgi:catalase